MLAQWNFMARCASIDLLGFHYFSLGADSLICKYDDSKADKDGEKLSEKNMFMPTQRTIFSAFGQAWGFGVP
jgi:hypothetical protein